MTASTLPAELRELVAEPVPPALLDELTDEPANIEVSQRPFHFLADRGPLCLAGRENFGGRSMGDRPRVARSAPGTWRDWALRRDGAAAAAATHQASTAVAGHVRYPPSADRGTAWAACASRIIVSQVVEKEELSW